MHRISEGRAYRRHLLELVRGGGYKVAQRLLIFEEERATGRAKFMP